MEIPMASNEPAPAVAPASTQEFDGPIDGGGSSRPLAVVTGASRGIGRELAKQFADHDFDLIVAAHDSQLAEAVVELEGHGGTVQGVQVDLATIEGIDELCSVIDADGRPVEAVAVNAGHEFAHGVGGESLEETLSVLRRDVVSTMHLSRCVLPSMVAEGRGRVLFMPSMGALVRGPYEVVSHASTSFVQTFAEAVREELADTGVTVTALTAVPSPHEWDAVDAGLSTGRLDDPALVAEQGFEAMMAGDERVVACLRTRVAVGAAPDPIADAIRRRQGEPGSAN